jgi:hypothetical protein
MAQGKGLIADKGDFDGDKYMLHLKELGVLANENGKKYSFQDLVNGNDDAFNDIMRSADMQKSLSETEIKLDESGNLTKDVKIGKNNFI